jgi:hypothetical protein
MREERTHMYIHVYIHEEVDACAPKYWLSQWPAWGPYNLKVSVRPFWYGTGQSVAMIRVAASPDASDAHFKSNMFIAIDTNQTHVVRNL